MPGAFLQGLMIGGAMILPPGPQNLFVLHQGIRRQYPLLIALICTLSDALLIVSGVCGGSLMLSRSPWLLAVISWGGAAFLLWYAAGALRQAWRPASPTAQLGAVTSRRQTVVMLLAVTWLNPHVWLDTFVVLGSLGSQFAPTLRYGFMAGAALASLLWFFALAFGAAALAPQLARPSVQRLINLFVCLMMTALAVQLIREQLHTLPVAEQVAVAVPSNATVPGGHPRV